jgi:hypothetical protein
MPNGLRNFPGPCDPRWTAGGACFCFEQFQNLYPAAWKYRVTVESAPAPYDVFNGDNLVTFDNCIREPFGQCEWNGTLPGGQVITLFKWFDDPPPVPNEFSWGLQFADPGADPPYNFGTGVQVSLPLPSDNLPPFDFSTWHPAWTIPVIVVPRAWDFELP